jgi:hypothetical protein
VKEGKSRLNFSKPAFSPFHFSTFSLLLQIHLPQNFLVARLVAQIVENRVGFDKGGQKFSMIKKSWGLWLLQERGDIRPASSIGNGTGGSLIRGGNVPLNQWSHIATTYDSTTDLQKLYLNGAEAASLTLPNGILTSNVPIVIGNRFLVYAEQFKRKLFGGAIRAK